MTRWLRQGAGWLLLAGGAALVPLPGPGLPLMLAGLTLLSRDYARARELKEKLAALWARRSPRS